MTTHAAEISLAELSAHSTDLEMAHIQPSVLLNENRTIEGSAQKVYDLLQDVGAALSKPLDELLVSLAALTRQITLVDLCVVLMLEATDGQMMTMASSPDLRERGGSSHEVDLNPGVPRREELDVVGVLAQISEQRTFARPTEPRHAVLHVREEALARLLAVVADVDPGIHLGGDRGRGRRLDGRAQLGLIDVFTLAPAPVQGGERTRPRQAAGVGGHEALLAGDHNRAPYAPPSTCIAAPVR